VPEWIEAIKSLQVDLDYNKGSCQPNLSDIELPVVWPGINSHVLVRRAYYDPLIHDVLNDLNPFEVAGRTYSKVICNGTPGTTKSSFGLYAVLKAHKAGRVVIYTSAKLTPGQAFILYPDGRSRWCDMRVSDDGKNIFHEPVGASAELNNPDTVFIADGLTPSAICRAFTILITSPWRARWHELLKSEDVFMLFTPLLSLEEMLRLWRAGFSHVYTREEVVANFIKWNGVARLVLTWDQKKVGYAIAASLSELEKVSDMPGLQSQTGKVPQACFPVRPRAACRQHTHTVAAGVLRTRRHQGLHGVYGCSSVQ
jgi:hypothetical protein